MRSKRWSTPDTIRRRCLSFTPEPALERFRSYLASAQSSLAASMRSRSPRFKGPAARAQGAVALRRESGFRGAAERANPRSHREDSVYCQLRRASSTRPAPGRPDLAGSRAAGILAGRCRPSRDHRNRWSALRPPARCAAAQYARHARRASRSRASRSAATSPRHFRGKPSMPCCAPLMCRCANGAVRSLQRPTTILGRNADAGRLVERFGNGAAVGVAKCGERAVSWRRGEARAGGVGRAGVRGRRR